MKLILKTKKFIQEEFLLKDIKISIKKNFNKFDIKILNKEYIEIEIKKNFSEIFFELLYFTRLFSNIYLKVENFNFLKNKNFTYKIKNNEKHKLFSDLKLKVDLENYDLFFIVFEKNLLLDLTNYDLSKKNYYINNIPNLSLNKILINYIFYLMEIDKEKKFSFIDVDSHFGDFIIEVNNFNLREKNIYIYNIPFIKIFDEIEFKIEKNKNKNKNKVVGIVDDNITYKKINENIKLSKQKIKISQFDFDFLDVKFVKNNFDYCITQLKKFKSKDLEKKYLDEFFHQIEFIIKKKFCLISRYKFSVEKYLKKYKNIKLIIDKKIIVGKQEYYIRVFENGN